MSSTPFIEKQPDRILSSSVGIAGGHNLAVQVRTISIEPNPSASTSLPTQQCLKLNNETKKHSKAEPDDSFDVFLPLKVKNYKNGLKKPNNSSLASKSKKKKVTSSNRICPYFSKRRSPTSSKEERDLKLAIARSLEDISPSKSSQGVLNDIVNVEKSSDIVNEKKLYTQASNFLKSSTSKSKKLPTNTLLFRRTKEQRQEIIIKKIGILLVQKENIHDQCLEKLEINLISSNLEEIWDKNCTLWELSKIDVNNLDKFYVSTLEKFIDRPPVASEKPEIAMSDADTDEENASAKLAVDVMNIKREGSNHSTDSLRTSYNEFKEENNTCEIDFNKHNFANKDEFITDSLNILSDDLFSLFGSNEFSDFSVVLKNGESLPCHQFMLQARCPTILSTVFRSEASNTLDFTQYSSQSTRAFFKFIYSGKVDFIYGLSNEDKSDLYVLAKKYKSEFLENFLLKSFCADSFHVYSQSTCSPPGSPAGDFPDSSINVQENVLNKAHELFEKDQEEFPTSKKQEDVVLSFENLNEKINNLASTSGLNSPQINADRVFSPITDRSLYDIFKDEIKSPCNSSLISKDFQSKRKLDYSGVVKNNKKVCSENFPVKREKSPEIIILDSDSNEDYPIQITNIQSQGFKDDNDRSVNDLFKNSNIESDFNVNNNFGDRSEDQVSTENKKIDSNNKRSIDKYFEASFPDEVNENILSIEQLSQLNPLPVATPPWNRNLKKSSVLTPLQEIITSEATPKPDYDEMISPELKAELRKYGIKPNLGIRKARLLLRYIYDQIHPTKTDLLKHKKEEPLPSTSKAISTVTIDVADDSSLSDSSNRC